MPSSNPHWKNYVSGSNFFRWDRLSRHKCNHEWDPYVFLVKIWRTVQYLVCTFSMVLDYIFFPLLEYYKFFKIPWIKRFADFIQFRTLTLNFYLWISVHVGTELCALHSVKTDGCGLFGTVLYFLLNGNRLFPSLFRNQIYFLRPWSAQNGVAAAVRRSPYVLKT